MKKKKVDHKTVRIGKIISRLSGQDHLIQVEHYVPQKSSHKNHGTLYFVLDINHPQKDSQVIIDTIIETCIKHFYKNLDDTLSSLEIALRNINEKLADLAEKGNSHWIENLNGIIAAVDEHDIHITQTGTAEAFLIRNKIISHITEGLSDKTEDKHPLNTFTNISSGKMNLGDRVVMSSEHLFNNISLDRIRRLAVQHSPTTCAAEIARILAQENVRCIGTLIMEATTEEKLAKEVIKPQPEEVVLQDRKDEGTKFSVFSENIRNSLSSAATFLQDKSKLLFKSGKNRPSPIKQKKQPKQPPKTKQPLNRSVRSNSSLNFLNKLNQKSPNKQYLVIGAIIGLIIIFAVSITYIRNKQNIDNKKSAVESILNEAESLSNQAENAMIVGDRANAKQNYDQSLELLMEIESSPYFTENILALINEINSKLDEVDNISRIDINSPLSDLSQISEKEFLSLNRIDENLYSFSDNIAAINISSGKITNITGFDIVNFVDSTPSDENSSIIYYHNGQMQKFDPEGNTLQDLSTLDTAWKPATSIATYYNNIYLLTPMENMIFKYSTLGGVNYSSAENYINNAGALDLGDTTSFTIDGSIFALKQDGSVIKFLRGDASEYKLSGIPGPYSTLSNPTQIFTNEDLDFIYILDPENKRILEFNKESGEYTQQIVGEELDHIDGFVVNEKIRTVYILADNKIFTSNLK
ncbi:hypothetical protein KJ855_02265 [Patescibacteria group bacterium]|nr:hypothetical protein [Patescibacteria group bacterium]